MSRPYRPGSKGRPTPRRGAQRRRRYLLWALARHTADQRQWRGAMALYTLMLNRWSDDDAKGVYPSQVRMGAELGCCDRQVRRYLVLLVAAGFLTVLPGKRHPRPDGTWWRSNNLYVFRFPSKKRPPSAERTSEASHPTSGKIQAAPAPPGIPNPVAVPATEPAQHATTNDPPPPVEREDAHRRFAELRATLRRRPSP